MLDSRIILNVFVAIAIYDFCKDLNNYLMDKLFQKKKTNYLVFFLIAFISVNAIAIAPRKQKKYIIYLSFLGLMV